MRHRASSNALTAISDMRRCGTPACAGTTQETKFDTAAPSEKRVDPARQSELAHRLEVVEDPEMRQTLNRLGMAILPSRANPGKSDRLVALMLPHLHLYTRVDFRAQLSNCRLPNPRQICRRTA